jgi:hypothetical protein
VQNFVQSLASAVTRLDSSRRSGVADKPPAAATGPAPLEGAVVPGLHPEIIGTIGEEFAHSLTLAMELVLQTAANPRLAGATLGRSHFLMDVLRRKAMSLQQISRLATNSVRQSHEKLALHMVAQTVLDERRAEHSAAGLIVNTRFKPVEIIVDPGLLMSLIGAALDWVTEFGTVVRMNSSMKNWPQHGLLSFSAAQGVRTQEDIDHKTTVNQSIAWHLLQQTALAMGVGLQMDETVHERNLTIEFPRTVVALEGMTIMEMGDSPASDSFGSVNSNFIAGHQILVLSSDIGLYRQVRDICKGLSLHCDHAPNVQEAERMCEKRVPHLIVCEELLADNRYDVLLAELDRHSPGFPTIMVGEAGHGFELSGWSGNNKSRISRKEMAEQLPSALTVELTRTF